MRVRKPLSVLIITQNEERVLGRCLGSLAWLNHAGDEIIVVDAQSSDRTPAIAKDPEQPWSRTMRFHTRAWTGFRDQRNFALAQACNSWVFSLDADEAVTPELAAWLQQFLASPAADRPAYFKIRRQEYFLGRPVRYGIWNPSFQDRFFHRDGVEYVNEIHEYARYPGERETHVRVQAPIDHDPSFDVPRFLAKMRKYTAIEAADRVRDGKRTNVLRVAAAFPAMFLKNYFYYRSYKDGWLGLLISVLEGLSRYTRHKQMWRLQKGGPHRG